MFATCIKGHSYGCLLCSVFCTFIQRHSYDIVTCRLYSSQSLLNSQRLLIVSVVLFSCEPDLVLLCNWWHWHIPEDLKLELDWKEKASVPYASRGEEAGVTSPMSLLKSALRHWIKLVNPLADILTPCGGALLQANLEKMWWISSSWSQLSTTVSMLVCVECFALFIQGHTWSNCWFVGISLEKIKSTAYCLLKIHRFEKSFCSPLASH